MSKVVLSTDTALKAFQSFPQPQNGYYLPAQKPTIKQEKNKHNYKKTIIISSLVAGFGTLALMKGALPKTLSKYLDKWKIKLEQKSTKGGKFQNFYRYTVSKINSFLEKTESINNFTTLKDVLFQKLMCGKNGNRPFTSKIHKGITRIFDRISRNTVNSAYSSTNKKFATLNEYLVRLNERILSENPSSSVAINEIKDRMTTVNQNLERGFGLNARKDRLEKIRKATEDLFDEFWGKSFKDLKNFKSKNMYQTFIAEAHLQPKKMDLASETSLLRQAVTHDIDDSYKASIKAFDDIQKFVNPTDIETNAVLNELRTNLNKYKRLAGKDEITQRSELNQEILANLRKFVDTYSSSSANYDSTAKQAISSYIKKVEEIVSNSKKGELQEILSAYKKLLPRKEYLKLKAKVQSAVKSLDKSIDIEVNKYFDKARDLKLGSAPTDVLSILGAVGAVGWAVGKSKDKDERISATLKYGIPAIGAISTSLFCTAKLISGGKALFFGLASGWAINKVGIILDEIRKQYNLNVKLNKSNKRD